MCGFAGIWYAQKDRKVMQQMLQKMTMVLTHRGPDSEGFHFDGNLGLGFRRLSIIDLDGGNQPMCDAYKKVWIVFNGEIYNYRSLRSDLTKMGYVFINNSDTEVILNAYLEYGEEFVDRLRGMFAFAIWDKNKNKMILGRDRFGIKPLYYHFNQSMLAFGSEIKSILQGSFSSRQLDWQAVDSYFSYGYIISPLSIYQDIRKLSPGHLMIVKSDGLNLKSEIKRYWKPTFTVDKSIGFDDYKVMIQEKLFESVKAHLVSDVPVGAFLSGGIDSNAVVSTMVKLYPDKVKTFSIGFNESEYNEAVIAKKSSAQYCTEHTELYLNPESADKIDNIIDIYDEPFADSSAIPTYFVSKLASQSVKVVLSGDGGDEFFGGYQSYQRLLKIQRYKYLVRMGKPLFLLASKIMSPIHRGKRFLYSLSKDPDLIYAYTMQIYESEKKDFFHPDIIDNIMENQSVYLKIKNINNSTSYNYISRMMELDIETYMADDILTKVDRASMANSLEVRVPIIDHEFFETASRIPSSMKINKSTCKYIFRESVKEQIPEWIYSKPKTGFTIPITKWFKSGISEYYIEMLNKAFQTNIFNPIYIQQLIQAKNLGSLSSRIWPIIVFTRWKIKMDNL